MNSRPSASTDPLGSSSKVRTEAVPDLALRFPDAPEGATALDLTYPLLGPRQYAHGSSMLEGMLKALERHAPQAMSEAPVIREFKVIKQFATLARAEAMETAQALKHPRLSQAAARLDVTCAGLRLTSLLFPTSGEPSGRLPEYDPAGYLAEVRPGDAGAPSSGVFTNVHDFIDLVRGLNECNRQLTVMSFPSPDWSDRVRWAYIQKLPVLAPEACAAMERVSFLPPETVDLGEHRFEIKQGCLEGPGAKHDFSICFFIELPTKVGGTA